MPFLPLDGCELYYETTGSGPALVFAHGLAGNHLSWWQQVPHFRGRYTCVTFAHRGFWPSTGAAEPERFASDLAALIDHLAFDDVRLIAQSMGGWTCLSYALRHPERVRALAMSGSTGTFAHPEIDRIHAEARRDGNPEADLFARGVHPAAGERMAREQPELHYLYQRISDLSDEVDRQAVRRALVAMRTTPPETLAALRTPLLCVSGQEDIVVPPAAVALFASLAPGGRLERVPEAGHSVYFERAATYNRLVDEFLASA